MKIFGYGFLYCQQVIACGFGFMSVYAANDMCQVKDRSIISKHTVKQISYITN